jgi:LCP family protein required for cell wall assembly
MRIPGWLFLIAVIALVAATVLCSVGSYAFAKQFAVDLGRSGVEVAGSSLDFPSFLRAQPTTTFTASPHPATSTPRLGETTEATTEAQAAPTGTVDPLAGYTWNDPRRVNILLLGIDQRGNEEGPFRTDTIMVASVDPVRKTVGILTIPRDLYVTIPGFRFDRINNANVLGDANAYPGGGPALAAETVRQTLGIDIDYYVRINFDVFTAVVQMVAPDGVEVCPPEEIDDQYYPDAGYGFLHIHFDAGCQTLDAERLLQYARTRHGNSDIDRSIRQQEVMLALREAVLSAGGITNILTQVPTLYNELTGAYETNLALTEIIALANLAQEIPRENIVMRQIGYLQVSEGLSPSGEQILTPNYTAIRSLIDQVFNPQPDLSISELRQRAVAENATIVVYNNTDISGLASQMRDWLNSQGVSITSQPGNMPEPSNAPTSIRDYTGSIWTARYLAALLGLPQDSVQPGAGDGLTSADVMVVVGTDAPDLIAAQGGE